jgi:plasmid rolling circle replication initiator protein Rep
MSTRGALDMATLPTGSSVVNEGEYLSEVLPCHKPWDQHRGEADDVTEVYAGSPSRKHRRYAERVASCAQVLEFARDPLISGKSQLKLKSVWFCRVRHCPVCQWRRSLMWQVRVYQALPLLIRDFPETRFLFLTLTVKNCSITQLRSTLGNMAKAWKRMNELQVWPAIGWVRSVEVTCSRRDGGAHPHYHCLLMVPPTYFKGDYLEQRDWAALWQQSLRVEDRPVVDVRVVRPERRLSSGRVVPASWNIWGAVVEILKYAVKPSDMVRDPEWFLQLVDEVHKTRAVAIGGVLKRYIRKYEKEDFISVPEDPQLSEERERLFFRWQQQIRRYQRKSLKQ